MEQPKSLSKEALRQWANNELAEWRECKHRQRYFKCETCPIAAACNQMAMVAASILEVVGKDE